jgi:hypothetical protein
LPAYGRPGRGVVRPLLAAQLGKAEPLSQLR